MGPYSSHYWENPYDSGIPRSDRRSGDYRAYTPTALAGMRLAISPAVDAEVAAAERAVRSLNRGSHGDLGLVSRFLLRSEAIASSYIEGITPSPRNVALAELALDEDVRGLTETAQQVARNMTIVRAGNLRRLVAWGVAVSVIAELAGVDVRALHSGGDGDGIVACPHP